MFSSEKWFGATDAGFYSHTVGQSLRFEDGDSAYLNRTPSSTGNSQTFTFSAWVKRANLERSATDWMSLFSAVNASNLNFYIAFNLATNSTLDIGQGATVYRRTNELFRDPNAWYHIVVASDTTNATDADRLKVYVNGSQITTFSYSGSITQNGNWYVNTAVPHGVGCIFPSGVAGYFLDGYMAEVNFIDGQQLAASSFGEFKSGIWIPKDTSGLTFGTNGFRLKFQDSSALGDDTSGNGNDYTSNGLAATDVVLDSPTNNFCVVNPIYHDTSALGMGFSEGNLKISGTTYGATAYACTFPIPSTGKWFYEQRYSAIGSTNVLVGVRDYITGANDVRYVDDGTKVLGSTFTSYGSSWTTGDVIGVAVNMVDEEVTFYKNGVSQGVISINTPSSRGYEISFGYVTTAGTDSVTANFGQDSSFAGTETAQGNTDANGEGDFYYTPPSGYLALCTANLPDPAIDPAQDESPTDYFNTVLWSGNGTSGVDNQQAITGVGFQPDFAWIKSRNNVSGHALYDVQRGTTGHQYYLSSDSTMAEDATYKMLTTFDSDGYTVSTLGGSHTNRSGWTYVGWNWLAGGTASSNTDGSITSSVSANTKAGFSIMTGTTPSSFTSYSWGHGLSQAPEFIIWKQRGATSNWNSWSSALSGATNLIQLNTTTAEQSGSYWGTINDSIITQTGSTFSNTNTTFVSYAFHSVDGYSKVGSYTGNGSSDGTFVYTGFRPAWILIKNIIDAEFWTIIDNKRLGYNETNSILSPNSNTSEYSAGGGGVDILSNGFKLRGTSNNFNGSSDTHIYLAFAEQPAKYSNAR